MTQLEGRGDREVAAAHAYDADQQIRVTVRKMRGLWVQLAEQLYRFHRAQLWRDLDFDTFEAWLEDPELELERRWVYQLIDLYQTLSVERQVPIAQLEALHVSKVREVLPAIRRGQVEIETALSDAGTLTRRDLELRYRGLVSGTPGRPDVDSVMRTEREAPISFPPEPSQPPADRTVSTTSRGTCPSCGRPL